MEVIVLQHIKIEDPGYIKDLMLNDGLNITTIELDEGEKIPKDLNKFDAMLCMGGPMDTYMEDQYPWLINEKKKIKEFVINLKKPYLGFCLGCQLLGEIAGGKIVKSKPLPLIHSLFGCLFIYFFISCFISLTLVNPANWHPLNSIPLSIKCT